MLHEFGNINSWTADKLEKVKKYLDAYLVALKNQPFQLEYIDVFAGTGYVNRKIDVAPPTLFDSESVITLKEFIDGSARVALQTSPPFSQYRFIEKHRKRCKELEQLKTAFPHLETRIEVACAEANRYVQELCAADWIASRRRGVMFLDPYGTQVRWETITAIARTQAIDLWILFPISTVNRLLNRDGHIREVRKKRLDELFGDTSWFDTFYEVIQESSLFPEIGESRLRKTEAPFELIAKYFIDRLRTVFSDVAPNPYIMRNSTNSPLFLLCFAAGNPQGAPIAVRIAHHILGKN